MRGEFIAIKPGKDYYDQRLSILCEAGLTITCMDLYFRTVPFIWTLTYHAERNPALHLSAGRFIMSVDELFKG